MSLPFSIGAGKMRSLERYCKLGRNLWLDPCAVEWGLNGVNVGVSGHRGGD